MKKELIKNISILFIALFITILISEIFLRMIDYNYSPMKIEAISKNDWREFHSFKDDNFEYDPYLIWRPRKNYSVFNSQGFRGEELGVKKDNEFRIFAIGDSNTLGWSGEKNAPNWPMYLEELLRESNDRFTVINAGVWGYSSFQGLRRFKEILRFQPDMVLISFVSNDAQKVAFSDAEYLHRGKELAFYNILLKFRLGKLMIAFFDKFKSLKKDYNKEEDFLVPRVSLEQYKNNLKEIIRISKENNIQPVLLTRPYMSCGGNILLLIIIVLLFKLRKGKEFLLLMSTHILRIKNFILKMKAISAEWDIWLRQL
jgi:lysophospholipase L1-like esterase